MIESGLHQMRSLHGGGVGFGIHLSHYRFIDILRYIDSKEDPDQVEHTHRLVRVIIVCLEPKDSFTYYLIMLLE